jgi:tetratricopeptide (TPR) repeat protein
VLPLTRLLARFFYWLAQGVFPLGRLGARAAAWLLDVCLAFDPHSTDAQGWRHLADGMFCRERGDVEGHVAHLRRAAILLPDNDTIGANLGMALALAGRHDEAVSILERTLRGNPDLASESQLWMALSWAYLHTGRAPKALEACDRATEHHAASPRLQVIRLLAAAACRGFVARPELTRLLRIQPACVPLVLDFLEQQVVAGSTDLARQVLGCMPESLQTRALALLARGLLNGGHWEGVEWAARELQQRQPQSELPATFRAEAALRRGDSDSARKLAQAACRDFPSKAAVWEQLARVHLARGELQQCMEVAAKAADISPGELTALAAGGAALYHLRQGNLAAARRLFAVTRSGDALACLLASAAQATILLRSGHSGRAADHVKRALEYYQDLPPWVSPELGPAIAPTLIAAATDAPPEILGRAQALLPH